MFPKKQECKSKNYFSSTKLFLNYFASRFNLVFIVSYFQVNRDYFISNLFCYLGFILFI